VLSFIERAGSELGALEAQVVTIYREAFSCAPYFKGDAELDEFVAALHEHMQRAGFRMVAAEAGMSGTLVGFAYGYTSLPDQWWQLSVRPALSAEDAARWLDDSFQLVEIAVPPEYQGRGIGNRLHDVLLRGLPHCCAVLSTLSAETPAMRMYQRRGWVTLLEPHYFPDILRPYAILGLDLAARRD